MINPASNKYRLVKGGLDNKKLRLLCFRVVVDKGDVLIDAPRSGME